MENLIILQARTSSSRLPGKALLEINGKTMIEWQIRRLQESSVEKILLVTTVDNSDDQLSEIAFNLGIEVLRGSVSDVHSRFTAAVLKYNPKRFIRITGDCPLVMPDLIDEMLEEFLALKCEYLSNTSPPSFPDGLDVEIVSSDAFMKFSEGALTDLEKEHVTLGLYSRRGFFHIENFRNAEDLSKLRWTVDYEEDYRFVCEIYSNFKGVETEFRTSDILKLLSEGRVRNEPKSESFRNIALKGALDE